MGWCSTANEHALQLSLGQGEDWLKQADRASTLGRICRPEDVASAILFLLSDLAGYITGQTILTDGGLNLKWTHLGADNTSLFLKDPGFKAAIQK